MVKGLINLGSLTLVAIGGLIVLYKLLARFMVQFIEVQRKHVEAETRMSDSLKIMSESVAAFIGRDNKEHNDLKIMLKVLLDRHERQIGDNE
jgi:hypothetical protein